MQTQIKIQNMFPNFIFMEHEKCNTLITIQRLFSVQGESKSCEAHFRKEKKKIKNYNFFCFTTTN